MLTAEQKEALAAPLARAHVKERKQAGRQLSYIEGWVAISEANRIFGFDGWNRETVRLEETNRELVELVNNDGETYRQWRVGYLAKVRVVVDGIVREGTGFGSGMARPEALGEAVESAAKEAETDAMKRALMTFGNPFGLALYDKTQENVEGPPTPAAATVERLPVKTGPKDFWGCAGPGLSAYQFKKDFGGEVFDTFRHAITDTTTGQEMREVIAKHIDQIKLMPLSWRQDLRKHCDEHAISKGFVPDRAA